MVTVCPSQFATRRTLFHVLVGCGLLMLKVSRLKLPVIWLLVSMWLNTLTKSQIWTRLMNAMRQAHADGWFIVFDTLTLADDRLEAFYDNPNALRDYFRDIGRMVLAAEGRKAND